MSKTEDRTQTRKCAEWWSERTRTLKEDLPIAHEWSTDNTSVDEDEMPRKKTARICPKLNAIDLLSEILKPAMLRTKRIVSFFLLDFFLPKILAKLEQFCAPEQLKLTRSSNKSDKKLKRLTTGIVKWCDR